MDGDRRGYCVGNHGDYCIQRFNVNYWCALIKYTVVEMSLNFIPNPAIKTAWKDSRFDGSEYVDEGNHFEESHGFFHQGLYDAFVLFF